MSKIWGIPSPYKSGPKTTFWTTSELNGNFNGLYLRDGTRYRQSVKCVNNYKGSPLSSKMLWTSVHRWLQTRPAFFPPSVNCAFHFIAKFRRRRSANGTQPNFAKRWMIGRANQCAVEKLGSSLPKKLGPKNFYICSVFRRLWDLMANICWKKRDVDNPARALENTRVILRCPKISWTLVHKQLKTGPDFLPTLAILFCLGPFTGASHSDYKKRHWVYLQLRFEASNAIASCGLAWQYIAIIATFSSYIYSKRASGLRRNMDPSFCRVYHI